MDSSTESNWHRATSVDQIPVGEGRECVAGDRLIAVFNLNGEFYALDGVCPHQGGPLGKGCLRGPVVTCPWHGWQFDVRSGKTPLGSRVKQAVFEVKVEGQDVLVAVA